MLDNPALPFIDHDVSAASRFIAEWEGCKLKAYQCSARVWTIGYGHTKGVKPGLKCTQQEAMNWLEVDLATHINNLAPYVIRHCSDGQFIALASLVFNVGVSAVSRSTLLKHHNAGLFEAAANQFLLWDKVNGVSVTGLSARRNAERVMYLFGSY